MFIISTFFFFFFFSFPSYVSSHGCMNYPNPRGSLTDQSAFIFNSVDAAAPVDWKPHFPAGFRGHSPGSGLRSQIHAAGRKGWVPFTPFNPNFRWRSGVCGDMTPPRRQHHLKYGKYYHGAEIVHTYTSGSLINVGLSISAHHNGFMQLHLCDIAKCPGIDISERCFSTPGACIELKRAQQYECDSGMSTKCGPIDKNYPGRWYFPCSKHPYNDFVIERFGHGSHGPPILYKLPDHWYCQHCVLHWYWSTAHTCNPPGVVNYFTGKNRPKSWGSCVGAGGARGGFTARQKPCGKRRFPEEYMQCADIRIVLKSNHYQNHHHRHHRHHRHHHHHHQSKHRYPQLRGLSDYEIDKQYKIGHGAIRGVLLIVNGIRYRILHRVSSIDLRRLKVPLYFVCLEAIVERGTVRKVLFLTNRGGRAVSTGPRFYSTGKHSKQWDALHFNQWIHVTVTSNRDRDIILLRLVK